MTNFDHGPENYTEPSSVVTCDMDFLISEPAEVVTQIVASSSAGRVTDGHFEVLTDGRPPSSVSEAHGSDGATMHIIRSDPGRLTVTYRAEIRPNAIQPQKPGQAHRDSDTPGAGGWRSSDYQRQVYLRPSRYCPSDHLIGFAVAEFGAGPGAGTRIARIAEWIRQRIGYVPGSSTVHDSAEDTLLTGVGTCRDFAHLGIALCRATGVPARFAAVYAPGLSPMDFHAVFEAFEDGRWCVHDPTGLAPRASLVRIVTGRDAADTAFAAVTSGIADLENIEITATSEPFVPVDNHLRTIELA
jgi:transglutaminase-like putative cysteine protease